MREPLVRVGFGLGSEGARCPQPVQGCNDLFRGMKSPKVSSPGRMGTSASDRGSGLAQAHRPIRILGRPRRAPRRRTSGNRCPARRAGLRSENRDSSNLLLMNQHCALQFFDAVSSSPPAGTFGCIVGVFSAHANLPDSPINGCHARSGSSTRRCDNCTNASQSPRLTDKLRSQKISRLRSSYRSRLLGHPRSTNYLVRMP